MKRIVVHAVGVLVVAAVLALPALAAERPNDRAGAQGVGSIVTSPNSVTGVATIPGRPDGRQVPDSVDLGPARPTILATTGGFHWGDAAIGLAGGLGLALVLAGLLVTAQHTRRVPDAF